MSRTSFFDVNWQMCSVPKGAVISKKPDRIIKKTIVLRASKGNIDIKALSSKVTEHFNARL